MAITSNLNSVGFEDVINMFGIDPLAFNELDPTCLDNLPGCEQFWTQYYESGKVTSREELSFELYRAEIETANFLQQWPFQKYTCNEHIEFEACYRNKNQLGTSLTDYVFSTKWQCVQSFGTFEDIILGTATVTLFDNDGDGFSEIAEIQFDYSAVTETFTVNDLKLTFKNYYEYNNTVYPILLVEDDTVNSVITFTVNSWNLVKPELYVNRSFVKRYALDGCNEDNFATELDVVINKKVTCSPDGYVYYSNPNCVGDCEETKYPFCAQTVNSRLGLFKIVPGYLDENNCFIPSINCLPGRKPTRIEINYMSGCKDCYTSLSTCNLIKRAIIYLAVSRLPRTLCECGCSTEFLEELKTDTSITYQNSTVKFNYPFRLRENAPFGTKVGELEAYKILNNLRDNLC